MELHFLGRSYFKSRSHIKTVPSDYTVCYRGQKYHLRAPVTSLATSGERAELSISIRKYRGVSYIVEHQNPAPPKQREFCHQ